MKMKGDKAAFMAEAAFPILIDLQNRHVTTTEKMTHAKPATPSRG
jgi:hypothetical protein